MSWLSIVTANCTEQDKPHEGDQNHKTKCSRVFSNSLVLLGLLIFCGPHYASPVSGHDFLLPCSELLKVRVHLFNHWYLAQPWHTEVAQKMHKRIKRTSGAWKLTETTILPTAFFFSQHNVHNCA